MSFIKRVSVKGFLFLPPCPACPQFAFASEANSRACLTLGTGGPGQRTPVPLWGLLNGLSVPPLVLEEMKIFSSPMPLEPTGPGYWGPSWLPSTK